VIADPGERQIGDDLFATAEVIEQIAVARRDDQIVKGQHHPLGTAGGSRGVQKDGEVGALGEVDARLPGRCGSRIRLEFGAPALLDVGDPVQVGVVVIAQPARLVVDDMSEAVQAVRHRNDLVDLLLVFGDRDGDLGVLEHVGHLVGNRVRVDRYRHRALRLDGAHGPVEPGSIRAHDGDFVAALEAEFGQAEREGAHLIEHRIPAPGLPDAQILVSHGRPATHGFSVTNQ
jgi:hypothetical protein